MAEKPLPYRTLLAFPLLPCLCETCLMAEKPLPYRTLRKVLKSFGIEEEKRRGKGSERMFAGVVNGRVERYPTKCHSEGDEKPKAVIKAIRRRFGLTEADGVTDQDFYGRA